MSWWYDESDDDSALGDRLTAAEAYVRLGLAAGTVRSWASRHACGLYAVDHDWRGRPRYYSADLIAVAARIAIRDSDGNRVLFTIPVLDAKNW